MTTETRPTLTICRSRSLGKVRRYLGARARTEEVICKIALAWHQSATPGTRDTDLQPVTGGYWTASFTYATGRMSFGSGSGFREYALPLVIDARRGTAIRSWAERFATLAETWHLNDMTAGSREQEEALAEYTDKRIQKALAARRVAGISGGRESSFAYRCEVLEAAGLHGDGAAYQYGSAWLLKRMSDDDAAEVAALVGVSREALTEYQRTGQPPAAESTYDGVKPAVG